MTPVGVGIIGAGDISRRYSDCLQAIDAFALRGVVGRDGAAALLADPGVELVVNLTPPLAHAAVTRAALQAGKHVYSEKPLAHDLDEALALVDLAREHGLLMACAPATHLGPAQQAVRHAIDSGALGDVLGGGAQVVYGGPDLWHHNPAPLFGRAAGPLFDLGVYFVNAFVHWFGSVRRVSARGLRARPMREVRSGPRAGQRFDVQVPTHVTGWMEFEAGPVVSVTTSFDSPGSRAPAIEVFGSRASITLPTGLDPFTAAPALCRRLGEWTEMSSPLTGWSEPWWAVGVIDAADALRTGREPRCSTTVAHHVLEVLSALQHSCETVGTVDIRSRCRPPAGLPGGPIADHFPDLLGPPGRA